MKVQVQEQAGPSADRLARIIDLKQAILHKQLALKRLRRDLMWERWRAFQSLLEAIREAFLKPAALHREIAPSQLPERFDPRHSAWARNPVDRAIW